MNLNEKSYFVEDFILLELISVDGKVFVWGYGEFGQLGLENSENRYTPQLLECPNESEWKRFFCKNLIGMINDPITTDTKITIENEEINVHKVMIDILLVIAKSLLKSYKNK